ncbi:MAG: ABC transporter ATP-binding protein [Polyangiaceae bacterium]
MHSSAPPPSSLILGTTPPLTDDCVLHLANVSKSFGERRVLDRVTLHLPPGEFLCLCGPNGAGKSTLLKIILGLVKPDSGEVRVVGEPPKMGRRRIGYVPQRKSFERDFPATPLELVVAALRGTWPLFIRPAEREKAMAALERTGAARLAHAQIANLSGGETQRVFLARALVTDPALLILDEPTAGVDVMGRAAIIDLLAEVSRSEHLAAVLVTHNLLAVERCAERVVYLEHRVRAWGTFAELTRASHLKAIQASVDSDGD